MGTLTDREAAALAEEETFLTRVQEALTAARAATPPAQRDSPAEKPVAAPKQPDGTKTVAPAANELRPVAEQKRAPQSGAMPAPSKPAPEAANGAAIVRDVVPGRARTPVTVKQSTVPSNTQGSQSPSAEPPATSAG